MSVEREYEEVVRPLLKSALVLCGTERLVCEFKTDSGGSYVTFSGEGTDKLSSAVFRNSSALDDTIAWAEDFLSMLRRLK